MTPTPEKALKAALEPKYMHPRIIWVTIPKAIALRGTPKRWSTFFHHPDPGMALSRAKAQVHLEVAVTQQMPQVKPRTNGGIRRQMRLQSFP
ncbi:uncharacterized protein N7529_007770 [Penicillium soppii]|jgi:hypothetical protein|uniref:uncharacterized protein n=1 Tax=Penicillium soppii TaxID=69789 RepID=UPI0025479294|nr:uncharacterized protein N7529_007770 [Penicillium soppii]KAJ5860460.1 hypothetical protein N7529_007770 [Penicillium soppii]